MRLEGAAHEFAPHPLHILTISSARDEFSEAIRFGDAHVADLLGSFYRLILKDHDTVGLLQDPLEAGMWVRDAFLPVATLDVGFDRSRLNWARSDQSDLHGMRHTREHPDSARRQTHSGFRPAWAQRCRVYVENLRSSL